MHAVFVPILRKKVNIRRKKRVKGCSMGVGHHSKVVESIPINK
jgi:hypothetical protein